MLEKTFKKGLLFLAITAISLYSAYATDYCAKNPQHTMCKKVRIERSYHILKL
jgi:hypothetical protein